MSHMSHAFGCRLSAVSHRANVAHASSFERLAFSCENSAHVPNVPFFSPLSAFRFGTCLICPIHSVFRIPRFPDSPFDRCPKCPILLPARDCVNLPGLSKNQEPSVALAVRRTLAQAANAAPLERILPYTTTGKKRDSLH